MSSERKLLIGNALDVLKTMESESVDVVVTSPPYWALRDYGSEPAIWGGDPYCEHEWGENIVPARGGIGHNANVGANRDGAANNRGHPTITHYCAKCGAWKGQLGLEPTPFEYIDHLMMIFDEVQRVLKPTGAAWINLGDSYSGHKTGNTETRKNNKVVTDSFVKPALEDIPTKSLCLIPQRFAIAMVERGWICRNQINWCLAESTRVIVRIDGVDMCLEIGELYEMWNSDEYKDAEFLVPSQNADGKQMWVRMTNMFDRGEQDALKITCTDGRSVICSPNHEFPHRASRGMVDKRLERVRLCTASELQIGHALFYRQAGLSQAEIDEDCEDYRKGWVAGFFVAEGSFERPRRTVLKNTKYSLCAQKRWADHIIPEHSCLTFGCGEKDITRGYVDRIKSEFPVHVYQYGTRVHVKSSDREFITFIEKYVHPLGAHAVHPTNEAFKRGPAFVKGIIDGFLAGDGHYDVNNDRWVVGICVNTELLHWMECACAYVGYEMRSNEPRYTSTGFKEGDVREVLKFTIRTTPIHVKERGWNTTIVESKVQVPPMHMYDIEVEQAYYGTSRAENKLNHLYFLGNGLWTHNCKPNVMPQSCTDRFTVDFEPMFFFTKEPHYYFKQLKEPVADVSLKRAEYGWKSKKANLGPNSEGGVEVERMGERFVNPEGRNMRTTWDINTSASHLEHCAMFPTELVARPIQSCCPPGGVVLDPFCGSGTTLQYCFEHDISAIGIEINPDFKDIIEGRMRKNQRSLGDFTDGASTPS